MKLLSWLLRKLTHPQTLNFDGSGRVSARVEDILRSANFQRQLRAIRETFR
jgi:hypothetical protein